MKYTKYLIIGTGPSVKELTLGDFEIIPHDTIIVSVNSSILFLPKVDIWFTLDDSFRNLRYAGIAKERDIPAVMALNSNRAVTRVPYIHLRRKMNPINPSLMYHNNCKTPQDWFKRWGCVNGLSETRNIIHTGNSLYGALNLVYFDRPKKIGILGLDGSTGPSAGGGHKPNNLSHLPLLFDSAAKQLSDANIEVMNGSPESIVKTFPRTTPHKMLQWLRA